MKAVRFVLKLVALSLTITATVCAIIAYWDKLTELVEYAKEKFTAVKAPMECVECSEYDDFVE